MGRRVGVAAGIVAVAWSCVAGAAGKCAEKEAKHARAPEKLEPALAAAQCHLSEGKYVLARLEFENAERIARARHDGKAQRTARKGMKDAEARLAWVTIAVPADAGVSEVRIDGQPAQRGGATPLDPGIHAIEASYAASGATWSRKLELRSGDTENVDVPANPSSVAASSEAPRRPPSAPPPAPSREEPAEPPEADDRPSGGPPSGEDQGPQHTGVFVDLTEDIVLYSEVPPGAQDVEAGHAWVTVLTVGYDVTPALRAFARYGAVADITPGRNDSLSVSNPELAARYAFWPAARVRVDALGGVIVPLGSGAGDSPSPSLFNANTHARGLYPALFDPNYFTPWLGAGVQPSFGDAVLRADAAVEFSFRTAGSSLNPDTSNIGFRVVAHAGYRVARQLEPFAELLYYRFRAGRYFAGPDATTVDDLLGRLGLAVQLAPVVPARVTLAYFRALDAPFTRADYQGFSLLLGADF
jgi:hypothetical protein